MQRDACGNVWRLVGLPALDQLASQGQGELLAARRLSSPGFKHSSMHSLILQLEDMRCTKRWRCDHESTLTAGELHMLTSQPNCDRHNVNADDQASVSGLPGEGHPNCAQ